MLVMFAFAPIQPVADNEKVRNGILADNKWNSIRIDMEGSSHPSH